MPVAAAAERVPASVLAERVPASAPALVPVPVGARRALAEELPVPVGALAELLHPVVAVRLQVGCLHPAVVVAWPP